MLTHYWRYALTCYHCGRAAGYLVIGAGDAARYQAAPGETPPTLGSRGRPVCAHCRGPLYQGEPERIIPIEPLEPEVPRKRGRPRKHPLPVAMPRAS